MAADNEEWATVSVEDLRSINVDEISFEAESPTDSPRAQGDAQVVSIDVDELLNLEYIEEDCGDSPKPPVLEGTDGICTVKNERPCNVEMLHPKALVCFSDWCLDGEKFSWRIWMTICYLFAFGLSLSLIVLWAYVFFPFQLPQVGFWENWIFNFVAHPVGNYIVARAPMGWFARQIMWHLQSDRSLGKEQRREITKRLQRCLRWVPLVDSLWCATEHIIFAGFHIFPVPFATVLSCIPAAWVSMAVFYRVLPSEARTLPSTLDSLKFTMCAWMGYCTTFIVMLFYTAFFPTATTEVQLAMSCSIAFLEWLVVKVVFGLGKHWRVPEHLMREMRTAMRLPVIVFKAMILSEAKGIVVIASMIVPEVIAVFSSFVVVVIDLTSETNKLRLTHLRSSRQLVRGAHGLFHNLRALRKRLAEIHGNCQQITLQEFRDATWSAQEIHLLNEVSSSLSTIIMLEVCEVMAPAIFVILLMCLRSNTFLAQNESFFLGLAEANFQESLIRNAYSLLLEVAMLVATDLFSRKTIGLSFVSVMRSVLQCDFSFWLSTLSAAYVGWLTVLVRHTGHDMNFKFLWLP
ncbi:unnamed protein product [Durusdinium trenchii]|uniref:Uncharacterized protein n=2 Tax=Durusdinium trenchii TaxID=1381693 RepID=A0ABP0QQH4_9DINO